jgi:hypothetical protein
MSDWPGWAGVIVSVFAFGASAYATYDARQARQDAKAAQDDAKAAQDKADRARELAIIDRLLNEHEIRRSHWDIWGYAEQDLRGIRTAIAEWREVCLQQMNLLPRDSVKWLTVRDLAEQANVFSRATDSIAQRHKQPDGYINITSDDDNQAVKAATDQFQQRTRELIGKLTSLRNSTNT